MDRLFYDNKIAKWDEPVEEGCVVFKESQAETFLVEFKGIEQIHLQSDKYQLFAQASKYLADINRVKEFTMCSKPEKTSREILFQGNFTLYEFGEINQGRVTGYKPRFQEPIWIASKNIESNLESLFQHPLEEIFKQYLKHELDAKEERKKAIEYNMPESWYRY